MRYFLAILMISIFFSSEVFAREIKNEDLEKTREAVKERIDLLRKQWPVLKEEGRMGFTLPETNASQSIDLRNRFNEEKKRFVGYFADLRKTLSEDSESKIEELRYRHQQFIEDHKERIFAKREEAARRLQEIKSKRIENLRSIQDNLKDNLKDSSDSKKAERLSNFLERINNLNDSLTDKYLERLSAIDVVLDKMELRAQILEVANRDITQVLSSIAATKELVVESRVLVLGQKEKTYIVSGDDLSNQSFMNVINQFKKDHAELRNNSVRPIFTALLAILNDLKSSRVGPILTEDELKAGIEASKQESQNVDEQENMSESVNN